MSSETAAASPRSSDRDGFAAWVEPSLRLMTRLAGRLVPAAEVDEVVQNALVRAWMKRDSFDPARGSATTWLLAIMADQARSTRRTLRRRQMLIDHDASPADTVSVDTDPRSERFDAIEGAVARLAGRQQLAVHLHYFLGLSIEQTAQVMGCTDGTVKSTLFDARKRLRSWLGDLGAD